MNVRSRVIMLIVYVAISMALIFLFGGFHSSGPLQALFILTGWTFIIYDLLHIVGWPAFVIAFVLYLVALSLLSARIGPRRGNRLPFVPVLLHFVGAALGFLIPGRDELDVGFFVNVLAWIIPSSVALFYFYFEWRFAGDKHSRSTDAQEAQATQPR